MRAGRIFRRSPLPNHAIYDSLAAMNAPTLVFDKLVYLDRLKSAGVSEEIARAHADGLDQALRESVATKADLESLEIRHDAKFDAVEQRFNAKIDGVEAKVNAKIDSVEQKLGARIDAVEQKLGARIDTVEQKLGVKIDAVEQKLGARIDAIEQKLEAKTARVETKIAESQTASTRWTVGTAIALAGLVWAIVKYSH